MGSSEGAPKFNLYKGFYKRKFSFKDFIVLNLSYGSGGLKQWVKGD
jgi:hypothetical protein